MQITIIKKDIKHIYIRIKPPSEVLVSVPLCTPQKSIDDLLDKKANWINKQLKRFENHKSSINYSNGDAIPFLGKNYLLTIHISPYNRVELDETHLHLYTQHNTLEHKQAILAQWYYEQAKLYFDQAITQYHPFVNRPIHAVRIKKMKTRWGSCNHSKGYINLNVELIKKPLEALEYVVFHELVHLIHPNHSKAFYGFIEKYMKDWKNRVMMLK